MRGTSTSSQCAHPLADYCSKTLKYRRMAVIADDIAYGHEMCAGFQRVFEELGGKIVQKMFPPLTVPDYGTYLAQLKTNIDARLPRLRRVERLPLPAPVQRVRAARQGERRSAA